MKQAPCKTHRVTNYGKSDRIERPYKCSQCHFLTHFQRRRTAINRFMVALEHPILVLGGLSVVGRHVVHQLILSGTVKSPKQSIVVVDRTIPALSYLSKQCMDALNQCSFQQVNLNDSRICFDNGIVFC